MKIIAIIKTNTVRHSVNDSTSTGLIISLFFQNLEHVPPPPPELPQTLNIYSVVIAVVIHYDCIWKRFNHYNKRLFLNYFRQR